MNQDDDWVITQVLNLNLDLERKANEFRDLIRRKEKERNEARETLGRWEDRFLDLLVKRKIGPTEENPVVYVVADRYHVLKVDNDGEVEVCKLQLTERIP